jgi:hypothetical protein
VKLLATKPEKKQQKPGDAKRAVTGSEPLPSTTSPAQEAGSAEPPEAVPGAFLRAATYDDHWITFGMPRHIAVLMNSNTILAPLKPTDGRSNI